MCEGDLYILEGSELAEVAADLVDRDIAREVFSKELGVRIGVVALLVPHGLNADTRAGLVSISNRTIVESHTHTHTERERERESGECVAGLTFCEPCSSRPARRTCGP